MAPGSHNNNKTGTVPKKLTRKNSAQQYQQPNVTNVVAPTPRSREEEDLQEQLNVRTIYSP